SWYHLDSASGVPVVSGRPRALGRANGRSRRLLRAGLASEGDANFGDTAHERLSTDHDRELLSCQAPSLVSGCRLLLSILASITLAGQGQARAHWRRALRYAMILAAPARSVKFTPCWPSAHL